MRLQVLVATVGQDSLRLVSDMNIRCDVLIANQADGHDYMVEHLPFGSAEMLTLPDRGVGLNRNIALMRSTADICLFADDDIRYRDDYVQIVINAFDRYPDADLIMFNVHSEEKSRRPPEILKERRVGRWSALPYGATFRIAVRRESIISSNSYFSLLFGGGARHASGEDILFVSDCIRKGLRAIVVPSEIAAVRYDSSSWFTGYDARYFFDKGVFFAHLSPWAAPLLAVRFAVKHANLPREGVGWWKSLRLLLTGAASRRRAVLH